MNFEIDYFRALETPRLARLGPNIVAAAFPLMKLMPARFILDRAEKSGELKAGVHIVETTSGTFGMAVALLAAARGYRLTLVTAATLIDQAYQHRLERLGANVVPIEDERGDGNQSGRLAHLQAIMESEADTFWTRQYDSAGNWLSYARLAEQFVRSMGQVDWLVGCVGTGGSLCGTGTFLRQLYPHLKIAAVDTHRSVLFGQPVGKRMLRGLGNSVIPKNVQHHLVDEVHWVGAYAAYHSAHSLLRNHGIFMGPTSGAAALVGGWIARTNPGAVVAVIMPDEGFRHANTVYNDQWLSSLPGWPCEATSEPEALSVIEPGAEWEWTRFDWRRRSLDEVQRSQNRRAE
ncbi:cysteine synthase [Mesorhizobium soli]|uniref:PLP-dependent cysteine synthase family protein n=1 Tax=Pseudaminobacter soli (ex Li et al. 2025) TaxID=1295366 RepID=UPI0024772C69|nr:PLP-dependent cysteine synthase family protein [Mesorhizobium soli]MDH6234881.1 cysteine synthase [Mesorhizobium soli]